MTPFLRPLTDRCPVCGGVGEWMDFFHPVLKVVGYFYCKECKSSWPRR